MREFIQYILDNADRYLNEGEQIRVEFVNKNRESYHGIVIYDKDGFHTTAVAPCLSIENIANSFEFTDFESALDKMMSIYRKVEKEKAEAIALTNDVCQKMSDYDFIKDKVDCRLVSVAGNEAYLADICHTYMADMALAYYINLETKDNNVHSSAPITKDYAAKMGLSDEVLYRLAQKNMEHLHPLRFCTMDTVISDMMGVSTNRIDTDEDLRASFMNLLTDKDGTTFGASILTHKEYMDQICEKMQTENLYFLPSSVHEIMVVNGDHEKYSDMPAEELIESLTGVVREANKESTFPRDYLSDNVYKYDFKRHELYIATDEQQRNAELAANANVNMRMSKAAGR
jgi:hypothetical protein